MKFTFKNLRFQVPSEAQLSSGCGLLVKALKIAKTFFTKIFAVLALHHLLVSVRKKVLERKIREPIKKSGNMIEGTSHLYVCLPPNFSELPGWDVRAVNNGGRENIKQIRENYKMSILPV